MGKLAIDGGEPLRREPFPPWPHFWPEDIEAAMQPLKEGKPNYWTGPRGVEFQRRFADFIGTKHGIAVNSGTSALHVALAAAQIGPGDEVITTSYTFIASAMCVIQQNAVPVFADVDPKIHNLDPGGIESHITERTRAIIPVHLYGHPCDMDPIMQIAEKHDLVVIEDCAQAHGAKYKGRTVGSIGHVNAFSFCQDKIFTTGGEGGFVATDDDEMAHRARSFKDHGFWEEERRGLLGMEALYLYIHHNLGFNFRMTEMQSAIGIEAVKRLPWNLERRAENAQYLTERIKGVESVNPPHVADWAVHAWYKYPITLSLDKLKVDRDQFCKALQAEGLRAAIGDWPENYLEEVFTELRGYGRTKCPFHCPWNRAPADYTDVVCENARQLGKRTIKLQVHPTLELSDMQDAADIIMKVAEAYAV
jgi:dTDP-4-amino-4,6-dideoxygalactose transaminase